MLRIAFCQIQCQQTVPLVNASNEGKVETVSERLPMYSPRVLTTYTLCLASLHFYYIINTVTFLEPTQMLAFK